MAMMASKLSRSQRLEVLTDPLDREEVPMVQVDAGDWLAWTI